jgi:hypothetical protein
LLNISSPLVAVFTALSSSEDSLVSSLKHADSEVVAGAGVLGVDEGLGDELWAKAKPPNDNIPTTAEIVIIFLILYKLIIIN